VPALTGLLTVAVVISLSFVVRLRLGQSDPLGCCNRTAVRSLRFNV
jgi:hypothetical protein